MKGLFLTLVLMTAPVLAQDAPDDRLTSVMRATVRVEAEKVDALGNLRQGRSYGTGTVFAEDDEKYYILTNGHVVDQGAGFSVQFFYEGLESPKTPAILEYKRYYSGSDVDLAILSVRLAQLRGYRPEVIPIAPADYQLKPGQLVYAASCPMAQPAMSWKSRVLRVLGRTVRFTHAPLSGQSGTGVVTDIDGKPHIAILLAWRISGNSKYGLGMSSEHVNRMLSGRVAPQPIQAGWVNIKTCSGEIEYAHTDAALQRRCKSCGVPIGQHRVMPDGKGGVKKDSKGNWLHCPFTSVVNSRSNIRLDAFVHGAGETFNEALNSGFG